jgi:hypothetical protein
MLGQTLAPSKKGFKIFKKVLQQTTKRFKICKKALRPILEGLRQTLAVSRQTLAVLRPEPFSAQTLEPDRTEDLGDIYLLTQCYKPPKLK